MMAEYNLIEYYNMFRAFVQVGENVNEAPRQYRQNHPDAARIPDPDTFARLWNRLLHSGSLLPKHANAGRRRTRLTNEMRRAIIDQFDADPNLSTRLCAVRLGIASHQVVHDVLKAVGRHPYRFQKVQHMVQPRDFERRMHFPRFFLQLERLVPDVVDVTLFLDESTFTPDGMFNSKNWVTWNDTDPYLVLQRKTEFRFSINVLACMIDDRLVRNCCFFCFYYYH